MTDLYGNTMFFIYNVLMLAAAPVILPVMALRLALRGKSRAGIRQRFGIFEAGAFRDRGDKTVWVHAVSVGETIAAVPLVKELKRRRRGVKVYFSTVTETGNAVAREKLGFDDSVFYFPFDLPFVADRVAGMINPDAFVVVETELWPGVLKALNRRGIPTLMVNGRISPRSYRGYRRFGSFIKWVLSLMTRMNMQTQLDADRIRSLGAPPDSVSVSGNVKFDQAFATFNEGASNPATRPGLGIPASAVVMIAGSTHQGEEAEAIKAYKRLLESHPDCLMILAPRHPERITEVKALLEREGMKYRLKSGLKGEALNTPCVILLDTMGELAGLYRVGDINFVGGSWSSTGGHNVLEPVAFGKPVFFGPNMHNFAEISAILKDSGIGIEVKDGHALAREAERLLVEPERMEMLGGLAKNTLHSNRGAVKRNVELIERYLYG